MKRIFIFLILIISAASTAADSLNEDGALNISVSGCLEGGFYGLQLSVYPSAELLYKPDKTGFSFLDVGAGLGLRAGFPVGNGTSFSMGTSVYGLIRIGFTEVEGMPAEMAKAEVFLKAGMKFDFIPAVSPEQFGTAVSCGIAYHLDDFTVSIFYNNWGSFNGGGAAVSLRLNELLDSEV